jgi:hypothetical protein
MEVRPQAGIQSVTHGQALRGREDERVVLDELFEGRGRAAVACW